MQKNKYAQKLGKKGGEATKKKYGSDHFRELAKKRWKKSKLQNIHDIVNKI